MLCALLHSVLRVVLLLGFQHTSLQPRAEVSITVVLRVALCADLGAPGYSEKSRSTAATMFVPGLSSWQISLGIFLFLHVTYKENLLWTM